MKCTFFCLCILLILQNTTVTLYANNQTIKEKTMTVEQSINKLQDYWTTQRSNNNCQTASDEELNTLMNMYKELKLPLSFIETYKICNSDYAANGENSFSWFGIGQQQYSIQTLQKTNHDMQEWGDWKKEMVFFYDLDGAYYAVLDLRENSDTFQKILCVDLELNSSVLWANSYEEWLSMAVDEVLQYGKLRVETIEKIMKNK